MRRNTKNQRARMRQARSRAALRARSLPPPAPAEEEREEILPAAPPPARDAGPTLTGVLEITSRGFGFVRPTADGDGRAAARAQALGKSGRKSSRDIFVAQKNLGTANHGDTVAVRLIGRMHGRREGAITKILARAWTRVCGIYGSTRAGGLVEPDNERLSCALVIGKNDPLARAAEGQAVLADIVDYGGEGRPPLGAIAEVLGDPLDARVQIRMALLAAEVPEAFSEAALAEAEALAEVRDCGPGREDLRRIPHVTIDGEDARDFDDAICVEADGGGFTLYVSIADVGHYVRPGTALDAEAYRRGTSIYLPDRVLPMLPERLSNHLCSLMPETERPAFTAVMRFTHTGRRVSQRFCKSLIKSRRRCTYTEVERLLAGDIGLAREYGELGLMLVRAGELATLLKRRRLARGGFDFDLPEPEVRVAGGRVVELRRAARGRAHMLVEDCMLAANEAVAETLAEARRPVLYRVHDDPDPEKLDAFLEAARSWGLETPPGRAGERPGGRQVAAILARATERPAAYALHNLLLRAMAQARYRPANTGHYGLGAKSYLHFTSPIRRYPDLVAHRVLAALLAAQRGETPRDAPEAAALAQAGEHLSRCERRAVDLERDTQARMAVLFLHDRVGESFAATVSGVGANGLYLELDEGGISGFVPLDLLPDDYWLLDSRRFRLIGERSGRAYQLGDPVTATLEEARLTGKRLVFSLGEPDRRRAG